MNWVLIDEIAINIVVTIIVVVDAAVK